MKKLYRLILVFIVEKLSFQLCFLFDLCFIIGVLGKMARKIQRSSSKCCQKHLLMALKMCARSMKSHLRAYKCGFQHLNAGQGDLRLYHSLCYNFQIIFHTSPLHQAVLSSAFHISLSYLLL